MKLLLVCLFILCFTQIKAQEITLFDSKGAAVAYIDTNDDDLPIYLWSGKAVAYISGENIYGFNGKHLGWWVKGIIRDHDGDAIGGTRKAIGIFTEMEPFKNLKDFKPFKRFKEFAPFKPVWTSSWSTDSFRIFLLNGVESN